MSVYGVSRKRRIRVRTGPDRSFLAYLRIPKSISSSGRRRSRCFRGSRGTGDFADPDHGGAARQGDVTPFSLACNFLVARWLSQRASGERGILLFIPAYNCAAQIGRVLDQVEATGSERRSQRSSLSTTAAPMRRQRWWPRVRRRGGWVISLLSNAAKLWTGRLAQGPSATPCCMGSTG